MFFSLPGNPTIDDPEDTEVGSSTPTADSAQQYLDEQAENAATANAADDYLKNRSNGDDEQDSSGKGPGVKDAYDLKNEMVGGDSASSGSGTAAGSGEGQGAAGLAAGTGEGAVSGAGEGTAVGAGEGATAGIAAGAAAGAEEGAVAGAASGVAVGAGAGAATEAGSGAATGAASSLLTGPLAPFVAPVTAAAGAGIGAGASSKTGRKLLLGGCIGVVGFFLMPFAMVVMVVLIFFLPIMGGGGAGGPGTDGGNSTNLTISKSASVTKFARGATNASVEYTITVKNNTLKQANSITVSDNFTALPEKSFASQITGFTGTYVIASLAPGASDIRKYTITIPQTLMDFDPGWILNNVASSSGSIEGSEAVEKSSAGVVIIIGDPPTGPPAFSPLKNPVISGYIFNQWAEASNGIYRHQGLDIDDANNVDTEIYSPFAQSATVSLNNPEEDGINDGFGNYVVLQSGEWSVYLTHLKYPSGLAVGSVVDGNTVIGIIGETGFSSGTHVHYEVHQGSGAVDPALYNALVPHP